MKLVDDKGNYLSSPITSAHILKDRYQPNMCRATLIVLVFSMAVSLCLIVPSMFRYEESVIPVEKAMTPSDLPFLSVSGSWNPAGSILDSRKGSTGATEPEDKQFPRGYIGKFQFAADEIVPSISGLSGRSPVVPSQPDLRGLSDHPGNDLYARFGRGDGENGFGLNMSGGPTLIDIADEKYPLKGIPLVLEPLEYPTELTEKIVYHGPVTYPGWVTFPGDVPKDVISLVIARFYINEYDLVDSIRIDTSSVRLRTGLELSDEEKDEFKSSFLRVVEEAAGQTKFRSAAKETLFFKERKDGAGRVFVRSTMESIRSKVTIIYIVCHESRCKRSLTRIKSVTLVDGINDVP